MTVDYKHENRRLLIFSLVIIGNLIVIGSLLFFWNQQGITDKNSGWALVLIVGSVCGLLFLLVLLLCFATTAKRPKLTGQIQSIYPTPEFQYIPSTILNRGKLTNDTMELHGSGFSILSTLPASSMKKNGSSSTINISPDYNHNEELKKIHHEDFLRVL
ncbi:hypothetical protein M3Y94_00269000 [Aphelenchoides besseyi]|nr:hypothetical protein M3Y94_00269000 [Aphelenchoides besseyi]KAI6236100.1 hypothetical protein M3Y95_00121800 [Aphelenchoides besseyi]